MTAVAVTGYIQLPCTHRSPEEYAALGSRLLGACRRAVFFRRTLADTWMAKRLGGVEPGGKDSVAYHCVQHEKFQWLEDAGAAEDSAADTLVWLDYGIMHMEGMTEAAVARLLERVEESPPDRIVSPSAGRNHEGGATPDWLFLGGVLVVPRHMAALLNRLCRADANHERWEVNTLAAVARRRPELFGFYAANHDVSMLENYACR